MEPLKEKGLGVVDEFVMIPITFKPAIKHKVFNSLVVGVLSYTQFHY